MLSWLAKKVIARNMARASAGDIGATLRMDAEGVRFRFPGDSSWGLLREYEVYEDTQKSKALDEYLASTGDPLSQQAVGGPR